MTLTNGDERSHDQELSLKELITQLRRGRWLVISFTVILMLAGAIASWIMPRVYEATVVISPVSDTSGGQLGGLSSLASQFSGIASLAGLSMAQDSKKWESLAVLESESLTQQYIRKNDLLPILYAKKWDRERKIWKDADKTKWPTLWKANQYFNKKIRRIDSNSKTGLVTMTIRWHNPKIAADWANDLVEMANDYLRARALQEAERNIAYLNNEAAKTNIVEARQVIFTILQTEINKSMLARGSDEYAFKVIDPASPSEKPTSPGPVMWILGGMLAGLMLSVLIAFVRLAWL